MNEKCEDTVDGQGVENKVQLQSDDSKETANTVQPQGLSLNLN